jgi:hypothetical protein
MVWVEHFTVGIQLLCQEVEVRCAGGRGFELSVVDGRVRAPAAAPAWPDVLLLDGSIERVDRWTLDRRRARFCCIADIPGGHLEIRNSSTNEGLALEWDIGVLPHLWMWHEQPRIDTAHPYLGALAITLKSPSGKTITRKYKNLNGYFSSPDFYNLKPAKTYIATMTYSGDDWRPAKSFTKSVKLGRC